VVRVVPTRCRDRQAAEGVLSDLEREADRLRAGVVTAPELAQAAHQRRPIQDHIDAYPTHLEAEGRGIKHVKARGAELNRLVCECGFVMLADLTRRPR
jgi:hypothetical protein